MNKNTITIDQSLIDIGIDDDNAEKIILRLASLLEKKGYVKNTFAQAVVDREKIFPTGLPFQIGVAIPHTDAEHVITNAIALGTLYQPVKFFEMGTNDKKIDVSIICLLAIKDPNMIIKTLRDLIKTFQDEILLKRILQSKKSNEIEKIFKEIL